MKLRYLLLSIFFLTPMVAYSAEYNTDRMGLDYRNIDLTQADPAQCQTICSSEAQCKAWTSVKPGVQGPKTRCWLKQSVPNATPNPCCVSGLALSSISGSTEGAELTLSVLTINLANVEEKWGNETIRWQDRYERIGQWMRETNTIPDLIALQEVWG